MGSTDLLGVHLELADNLDSDLGILASGVLCAVDVAEGAVAHLLDQRPPLETWITGQLSLGLTLFRDDALEDLWINSGVFRSSIFLLLVASRPRCRIAGLRSNVAVVAGACTD